MTSPTRYSPEVRERAVRLVLDHQGEHDSQWSAITSVASKLGCTAETLRKWVRQAERDRGVRAGLSSEERRRLKELERGELILHGARERHDRYQGKRQVERARLRLVEEGDIAVDERDRQCERQGSAAEADRQGGADAFRDGRLLRHDEILRAFSRPRSEEHAENACEHDAQGEAAASFRMLMAT